MTAEEISHAVIGAAIEVHRQLGPGLLESAYQVCLAHELRKRGHQVVTELSIPVFYDGLRLDCGFRADLIIEKKVIVELKAKSAIHPIDVAQVLSYLRLTRLRLGLLINFHENRLVDGIRRVVNGY